MEKHLGNDACRDLLRNGGMLVRNTFSFDQKSPSSFWHVIKKREEPYNYSTRDRNKIRHALAAFRYDRITSETLREAGYRIIKETYDDYAVRDRRMNKKIFLKYLNAFEEAEFDYWGIFDATTNELVGFSLVRCWEKACEYDISGVLTRYKRNGTYPYYGLFHTMNDYYLNEKNFDYISDGTRSITEHSHIHDFLEQHFGFRKAYCQLEVHYQWWMKIAVNLLYPFRKLMKTPRIKAILNMEAMQRGEK